MARNQSRFVLIFLLLAALRALWGGCGTRPVPMLRQAAFVGTRGGGRVADNCGKFLEGCGAFPKLLLRPTALNAATTHKATQRVWVQVLEGTPVTYSTDGFEYVGDLLKAVKAEENLSVGTGQLKLYASKEAYQKNEPALDPMDKVPEQGCNDDGKPIPFYVHYPEEPKIGGAGVSEAALLKKKKGQLREICRKRGLEVDGTKRELVQRIVDDATSSQAQPLPMEAYEKLVQPGSCRESVSFNQLDLIAGQVLDRSSTKEAVLAAITKLSSTAGKSVDKTKVPLMATTGIGGAGKSTICNLIRFGVGTENWLPDLEHRIQEMVPRVKRLIPLMATMNQKTSIDSTEDPVKGTISRSFADYTSATWESSHMSRLPSEISTLAKFAAWLRTKEAQQSGFQEDEVAVMVLVDEVKKVEDKCGVKARSALLDALAEFQQMELANGRLSFVLVTSLDVSTFADLTEGSKRPVAVIPVSAFSQSALEACRALLRSQIDKADPASDLRFKAMANMEFALSATGGHPRLVEEVMAHDDWTVPCDVKCEEQDDAAVPFLLCRLTKEWFKEDELMGKLTIRDMATKGMILYKQIDMKNKKVKVDLIPAALHTCLQAPRYCQEAQLIRGILRRLPGSELELVKLWERAIPMCVELKARAYLRAGECPSIDTLIPGTKVTMRQEHKTRQIRVRNFSMEKSVCGSMEEVYRLEEAGGPAASTEPRCVVATCPTQPGVELYLENMFEVRPRSGITLFWQMKMWQKVSEAKLKSWTREANKAALALGFVGPSTYIVICISQNVRSDPPPGVIYITADACAELLAPYGASPLKKIIQEKAGVRPVGS